MRLNSDAMHARAAHRLEVKVCGVETAEELNLLDRYAVDYAGLWCFRHLRAPSAARLRELLATPRRHVRCIGVFAGGEVAEIVRRVRDVGLEAVQLHGFQLPQVVSLIKRALGSRITVVKVLHVQDGHCLEQRQLAAYASCGADLFLIDSFDGRQGLGSTGRRVPKELLEQLVPELGSQRVLVAGGLEAESLRELRQQLPFRGVDVDAGARVRGALDEQRVAELVAAAAGDTHAPSGHHAWTSLQGGAR
jgi:phosphoribosylanthranilate isomerase